jgi:hypothetical protein
LAVGLLPLALLIAPYEPFLAAFMLIPALDDLPNSVFICDAVIVPLLGKGI